MDSAKPQDIFEAYLNQNAELMELVKTTLGGELLKKIEQLIAVEEAKRGKELTDAQKRGITLDTLEVHLEKIGVQWTKEVKSLFSETLVKIDKIARDKGVQTTDELRIAASMQRLMEQYQGTKNNVIDFSNKELSKNPEAKLLQKELKDIKEQFNSGFDKLSDKLKYFFGDMFEPKKTKGFIANLVTALAQSKALGGFLEDLVKIVTFMGASILSQFGTWGKVLGAALIAFGPVLAGLLGQGLLKISSAFLAPLVGPLLAAVGILGGLYAIWQWWYKDQHKNEETPGGFLRDNIEPNDDQRTAYGARASYQQTDENGRYFYSSEDWKKMEDAKVVSYDPNTGIIMDTARTTQENLFPALMQAREIKPKTFDDLYDIIDLKDSSISKYFDKENGLKTSAVNIEKDKFELVAGKEVKGRIEAYGKLADKAGIGFLVKEAGLQAGGRAKDHYVSPFDLTGDISSMNAQSGNSIAFGDYKDQRTGKTLKAHEAEDKLLSAYMYHRNEFTEDQQKILDKMLGKDLQYRKFYNNNSTATYASGTYRSVLQGENRNITEAIMLGEKDITNVIKKSQGQETSQASQPGSDFVLPEITDPEVKKYVEQFQSLYQIQPQEQAKTEPHIESSSSDTLNLPALPKVSAEENTNRGAAPSVPDKPESNAPKISPIVIEDPNKLNEIDPPANLRRASASSSIDPTGNEAFRSSLLRTANIFSNFGTDSAYGIG